MNYAFLVILLIVLCLLILGFEYLWLYVIAVKQENRVNKYSTAEEKITKMVDGIFYSPTAGARRNEIAALNKFIDNDPRIMEMVSDRLDHWGNYGGEQFLADRKTISSEIEQELKPVEFYANMLENGDVHDKSYACRKLADLGAAEYIDKIKEFSKGKKRILSYNAAMALSKYGDAQGVADYLIRMQDDSKYSDRIIFELISRFEGSREELAGILYDNCEDSMKASVISAMVPYKLEAFEEMYAEGLKSTDINMRIACVKAIGAFGKQEHEHALIIASKDKNWVVRIGAVRGLEKLHSPKAIESVKNATKDKEWWVRQTAANALLNMEVSVRDIEDIMKGYDRYAADAVKYSLYQKVDIRGDNR